MRSYVEEKSMSKWCPGKGCDSAIEYEAGGGSYDVNCDCGSGFRWNCNEEAHRPVDCETVAKWNLKNSSAEENTTWILANSKPCPKCKTPIEKNDGCMHMTCRPPCSFQFCWLCLGDWSEHGTSSGGYYACNRYEERQKKGLFDEEEKRRKMAKSYLKKYTHHYERWTANQKSRERALKDLQMRNVHLDNLSNIQGIPVTDLEFIVGACLHIVECRRVLKWAYAYGYYIPRNVPGRKEFFEYLQGEAETALERIHQCAEKELQTFLCAEEPSEDFQDFRTKLVGLTSVTRTYFENLVKALENGLEDVDCTREVSCSRDLNYWDRATHHGASLLGLSFAC